MTLVLGKGGVGRSTVARALVLAARARGERAVLVEPGSARRIDGAGEATRDGEPAAVALDRGVALEDAAAPVFGSRRVARAVLGNFAIARLLDILPGVHEYALLVAARALALGGDRVVVDMPATGHGIAWLGVPARFAALVPVGRAGAQAGDLDRALRDAAQTELVLVAVPEPLIAAETSELRAGLRAELGRDVDRLIVNRVPTVPLGALAASRLSESAAGAALHGWLAARAERVDLAARLGADLPTTMLAESPGAPVLAELAIALEQARA